MPQQTSDPQNLCIHRLLSARAEQTPDAVAITAPDHAPLSYGSLLNHIGVLVERLNAVGIGRNERVAMVLPQGPDMALAFLAVASCATSAPLNPAYRTNELAEVASRAGGEGAKGLNAGVAARSSAAGGSSAATSEDAKGLNSSRA